MKTSLFSILFLIVLGQTIQAQKEFKKGYIIDAKGEKVSGRILLLDIQDPNGFFKNVFFRKDGKDEKIIQYSPAQIQEFGFGVSMVFKSFSIPLLNKIHELEGTEPTQRFLRQINAGKIVFYALRRKGKYFSYYYSENSEDLEPLKVRKKPAENLRSKEGNYVLPGGFVINAPTNGIQYEVGNRVFLFDYGMFELIPIYKLSLQKQLAKGGCNITTGEEIDRLNKKTIYIHLSALNDCVLDSSFSFKRGGPLLNVSLFLTGSTRPGMYSRYQNEAIGGIVELKSLNFSSRFSLAFGQLQYSEGSRSFLLNTYVEDPISTRIDTIIERATGQSNLIRVGYHLRPEKNFRPFLYAGIQNFKFKGTQIDTQNLRNLVDFTFEDYSAHIGGGLDLYFLKFNQIRVQGGYVSQFGLEYYLSYGINFTL